MTLAAGARLNHYQILSPLGAGGMGEVYLAEDTRLRRKVALKLLPEAFTRNVARLRRFEQEARAASALNHPNILTIHEIGTVDHTHFIATEFIDGQTLREKLKAGALTIPAALDMAIQIAAALAAAHDAGIVHRDIKPENVMVRRDGIVKVLDFGLAKLSEEAPAVVESEAPTIPKVNTDPGTVLGTASYMSPEQARGLDVDARSDIFSLGLVLYEMVASRAPFTGANALEVISEILKTEPAPLRSYTPDVPAELQRIVTKALRKDREERYQLIRETLLDLKSLKQELEFEAKLKGAHAFVVPPSGGGVGAREMPPEGGTTNAIPTEAAINETTAARTTSSAEIILGEIKRHKVGVAASLVVLLGALGALGYGLYRLAAPKQTFTRFQKVKFTRLTSLENVGLALSQNVQSVSISPDGKFVAYLRTEGGQYSLWTKAVATGSTLQIVPPSEADLANPVFSPDNNYVYYRSSGEGKNILYQIPALGGTPKRVLRQTGSAISFSPDGKQLAFVRYVSEQGVQLIVANVDGSAERVLAARPFGEGFILPAWSPDGNFIAASAVKPGGKVFETVLLKVDVQSGEVKPLIRNELDVLFIRSLAWFKDGGGLMIVAVEKGTNNQQIWHLTYPAGELRRVTNDLSLYDSLSLTADGATLATIQGDIQANLWVTQLGASGRAQQLTSKGSQVNGTWGVRWVADGRIVYGSMAGGNIDLWEMNADGGHVKQLTDDNAVDGCPAVSPDGRYLVFVSTRSGKGYALWRTDLDGGAPKQLSDGGATYALDISPDGRWVIFDQFRSGVPKLYKVSIEGGSPILLTDQPARWPSISPDGKLIACVSMAPQPRQRQLLILPFEGGAPLKTLEVKTIEVNSVGTSPMRWTPDGRSLIYIDSRHGAANLWRLPLDGGPAQQVTNFSDAKPEHIWSFDLLHDGKRLILSRGSDSFDVVLISEVK